MSKLGESVNDLKKKMCVYAIKNLVNGKVYIGIAKNSFYTRYRGKWWISSQNDHLKASVRKYGLENFQIEILEHDVSTYEELLKKEVEYIQRFNSINMGYNKTTGGRQPIFSQESKDKKSQTLRGYYQEIGGSPFKGMKGRFKLSSEVKIHLSKVKIGKAGCVHTQEHKQYMSDLMTGREVSQETKNKLSNIGKQLIGSKNPNAKRVREITSNQVFETVNDLLSTFGLNRSYFCYVMKNGGSYKGLQFEYVGEKF